ncbi:MAG: hypothetical protein Kow0010_11300 [Dehalococcoidia bacterium]
MLKNPSLVTVLIAGGAIVAGATVAGAVIMRGGNSEGGLPPALDVRQDAVAEDGGIRVEALAAAFSGTGTFVELVVTITGNDYTDDGVTILRVKREHLGGTLRQPATGAGLATVPGRAIIVRFDPLLPGEDAVLRITGFELQLAAGGRTMIAGRWELPITTPHDLASRLRLENLTGASATDAGIRVAIEGAVRSTTETLITIRVDSEMPVNHLGQPVMIADGRRLLGGLVAEREDGRLMTYTFPFTDFGQPAEIRFGPFVSRDATLAGSVQIDLGAVIARAGLTGTDDDRAEIVSVDFVSRSGAAPEPTHVGFLNLYNVGPNIVFHIPGIREDREGWTIVSANGEELPVGYMGYGYQKDQSGVIHSPGTDVGVIYGTFDNLDGIVTITYEGATEEVVRGEWVIQLTPLQ